MTYVHHAVVVLDEEVDDLADGVVQLQAGVKTVFEWQPAEEIECAEQDGVAEVEDVEGGGWIELRRFFVFQRPGMTKIDNESDFSRE